MGVRMPRHRTPFFLLVALTCSSSCFLDVDSRANLGVPQSCIDLINEDRLCTAVPDGGSTPQDAGTGGPVWVVNSAPGQEGIAQIDPVTDVITTIPFAAMNGGAGISGTPHGITEAAGLAYVAVSSPGKLVVIDTSAKTLVKEISVGAATDVVKDVVSAGSVLYVANETANQLIQIDTGTQTKNTLTASTLTNLVAPVGLGITSANELVVGSDSDSQAHIIFAKAGFGGMGGGVTFDPDNSSAVSLSGSQPGTHPSKCTWLNDSREGYCAVAGGQIGDAGVPIPSVWHFVPGTPGTRVLNLPYPSNDVLSSPSDEVLYVSFNDSVSMYWIAGAARDAPQIILQTQTGAGSYRMALTADGAYLYVTNRSANTVTKLRATDLSVLHIYSNMSSPAGIYETH